MSTYVLMRILESAPRRYDVGIRLLTLGSVERAYDQLVQHIEPGQRVLDIGCGTGALTLRAAGRGARVKAIDISVQMLEIAAQRVTEAGLGDSVELVEMGVAELDREHPEGYDVVTSGLCLSELSEDELSFTLSQVVRILKPGGLFLVADEVSPRGSFRRLTYRLIRAPLAAVTYLLTQQTTRAIANLQQKVKAAGLSILTIRSRTLGSFAEVVAQKPGGATS